MRILMTADATGGVWTYALELAAALAARGITTTVATMGPPPSTNQAADAAAIPGLELVTSTFKLEWMDDPWADVLASTMWLRRLAARVQPSILHLNGYAQAAAAWDCPVLVAGHSCVTSWTESVGGHFDPAWMARYRTVVAAGLRAADHVVAPTEAMMLALQRHHGPLARRSVIANGRDPSRFRPAAKQPFVLTAGRLWDRAKNIDSVAAIAARLPWPVLAAGDAGRLEVGIRTPTFPVRYIGCLSQTELAEWLGHASIFVLPARYEPFGLLPLEAALSGCALVLGDIASLREVWGDAARYVDCNDPEHLRMEIQQLIDDAATRQEMADRARRRALAFTAARMGDAYTELYRNLARTRGAVRAGAAVARAAVAETS